MQIPGKSEFGATSFYGTENNLQAVLKRYNLHPARSDFYRKTKKTHLNLIKKSVTKTDIVLDIGCSFGLVTCEIAMFAKNVIGIDIDERQIRNARDYANMKSMTNTQFEICDAVKSDHDCNIATSLYAFHHVLDDQKLQVLQQIKANTLIFADITVPFSAKDERYKEGVKLWMQPRLLAAKNVSEDSMKMEENSATGVLLRENEYPITLAEYRMLFTNSGWTVKEEHIIEPYGDVVFYCSR